MGLFHLLWVMEIMCGTCIAFGIAILVAVVALSLKQARWTFSSVLGVNIAVSGAMRAAFYGDGHHEANNTLITTSTEPDL